jgi:hypothetical protein
MIVLPENSTVYGTFVQGIPISLKSGIVTFEYSITIKNRKPWQKERR